MMEGRGHHRQGPHGHRQDLRLRHPAHSQGWTRSRNYPQAVVMAPTRELAQQITEDLRDLAHFYPDSPRRAPSTAAPTLEPPDRTAEKGPPDRGGHARPPAGPHEPPHRRIRPMRTTTVRWTRPMKNAQHGLSTRMCATFWTTIKSRQRLAMFSRHHQPRGHGHRLAVPAGRRGDHRAAGGGSPRPRTRPVPGADHRPQQAGGPGGAHRDRTATSASWCSATRNTPPPCWPTSWPG